MSDTEIVAFLPWVTLPEEVALGGFRFIPLETHTIQSLFTDGPAATSIAAMLRAYVDIQNNPITSCTFIAKARLERPWYVPEGELPAAFSAARTLALGAMSEQRFFEGHLAPHINATAFRAVAQRISPPTTRIAVSIVRRDGELWIGGWDFGEALFQEPLQVHGTKCPDIPNRFVAALEQARRNENEIWDLIEASLPIWLLGNGEDSTLSHDACVTLCAIAFERLLRPERNALEFAKAFARVWSPFQRTSLSTARRVKPDSRFEDEQQSWSVIQKWARELYEERNVFSHHRRHDDLTTNWQPWQHLVLAAYAYPLTIKLLLEQAGLYRLSADERGCCYALDALLDRWEPRAEDPLNKGQDWSRYDDRYGQPTWSTIVSFEVEEMADQEEASQSGC
jgi:hypothetical protein